MIHAVEVIGGAIALGYWVAGLFFVRFWQETRDRLFLIFGMAFWILGIQRVLLALRHNMGNDGTSLYIVRLGAFLLILAAIIDKNRKTAPPD